MMGLLAVVVLALVVLSLEWVLRAGVKRRAKAGSRLSLGPPTRVMKLHSVIAWMATGFLLVAWLFPPWTQWVSIDYGPKCSESFTKVLGWRFILDRPEEDEGFTNRTLQTRRILNELPGGHGRRKDFWVRVSIDHRHYQFSFRLVMVAGSALLLLRALDWLLRRKRSRETQAGFSSASGGAADKQAPKDQE